MSVIAKPDGRDLSVSEMPFNYNAHLDVKKLRVGYLKEAFDEVRDPVVKKFNEAAIAQVEGLGLKLVPVKVPEWSVEVSSYGVESATFFDELIRSGRDKQLTNPGRANGWRVSRVMPAVDYLQSQRGRMMMMQKLAEATADVDVYLVPTNTGGGDGGGRGRGADGGGRGPDQPRRPQGPTQRHFTMANLACYPALSVPHGFMESGSPAAMTFYARPFGEAELLALGKAYQDASGFHLKHPAL
jgi:Asp-tRNA(Asn)/Glu-tRNA(Gln) amidotransferase A subunit family amidase